jgi:hypothetical protein
LLILADSGGSNGHRPRLWKVSLQELLADLHGLEVTVCHYPTGASKSALLLVQAAGQQVHLMMQPAVREIGTAEAVGALAGANDAVIHDPLASGAGKPGGGGR